MRTCLCGEMASSIAVEMMALIEKKKYKQIIPALPKGAGLSEEVFPRTSLSRIFSLDTSRWIGGSFMNPNTLFELFGVFSGQTSLQVRKAMFKYLGVTKKCGAEQCKTLMNAWIALHMQGLTAHQWADAMLDRETPGDEIAIYTLCRMYHRHCVVLTSAKCWTTLDTKSPVSELTLYENCDIRLLYIEPNVFGELRLKPAMPPVPTSTFIAESATAIVPRTATSINNELQPINLSMNSHSVIDAMAAKSSATGDNITQVNSEANMESVFFDPYVNAPLSGALDHICNPDRLDDVLNMFLARQEEPPAQAQTLNAQAVSVSDESVPEFPRFTERSDNLVKKCNVTLKPLTHIKIEAWSKPNDTLNEEGYNLRQPKCTINMPTHDTYTLPYGRECKRIVDLVENLSASSQDDDDPSVKPGW